MSFKFHKNKKTYFDLQSDTTARYILPFIAGDKEDWSDEYVMEVGCAEGAILSVFLKRGAKGIGVELRPKRIELARDFLEEFLNTGQVELLSQDIYDFDPEERDRLSLIVLKDVVEHIPNQEKLIPRLSELLAPGGRIFFAFPPWQMPFGGHQQVCKSKILSLLPYYHLLPKKVYKSILELAGEKESIVRELLEIKDTGISIERFERIVKQNNMPILKRKSYLFNPVYENKFGIPPREQNRLINNLPVLRNYLTTGMYYLIGKSVSGTGDASPTPGHEN